MENTYHDSLITNIGFDNGELSIILGDSLYENSYGNKTIKLKTDPESIEMFFIKRYPLFHRPKYKVKQLDFEKSSSFFKKHQLVIKTIYKSVQKKKNIIETSVYPPCKGRGTEELMYICFDSDISK